MLAEIKQLELLADCLPRSLRNEDLPAVSSGSNACPEMDVVTDVPLFAEVRSSGVDTDPHLHATASERLVCLPRSADRRAGIRKGDKERIALRVHLDAAVSAKRIAQDAAVFGQLVRVSLCAELGEQSRRSFDVGE